MNSPDDKYSAGAEYQLAERVLRDYDPTGEHGEAVVLARAYMAMVDMMRSAEPSIVGTVPPEESDEEFARQIEAAGHATPSAAVNIPEGYRRAIVEDAVTQSHVGDNYDLEKVIANLSDEAAHDETVVALCNHARRLARSASGDSK